MSDLDRFQIAFTAALWGDGVGTLAPWLQEDDETKARLSVYRNTVLKGCVEALASQFPTVRKVVGGDWLDAACAVFARAHPPAGPILLDYGADFADWLAGFEPAAAMPYLARLAQIDWALRTALFAQDAPVLDAAALATLAPADYASYGAHLHPAAQILWFEAGLPALWTALQAVETGGCAVLDAGPSGILISRPHLAPVPMILSAGGYALLTACAGGDSLANAAVAGLTAQPDLPLAQTFADLITAGAFGGLAALA